jgi:uncharacterized protein (DUF1697 family)
MTSPQAPLHQPGLIYTLGMRKYVAMIRGIGPENPNMRGAKLVGAFEQMGLQNVRSFLTSGNVLFESEIHHTAELEKLCEASLPELLGFSRDVFIRSRNDLQALVDADPFKGLVHENSGKTYLTITFFKNPPKDLPSLPFRPSGKSFEVVANVNGALCSVVDLTTGKAPDLMQWLDRTYGKDITTRTWLTITRLTSKLEN